MSSSHDPEHDAWLREALRHAPDAQVVPPRSVSELILREAQAKVRGATPPPTAAPASAFAAFWAWLGRPQVAAGAASLMIATVAGIMWWDRPLPGDDERSAAPLTARAPAAATPPELAAAPGPAAAPAAAPAAPAVLAPPAAPPAPERKLAKAESAAKRSPPSRDAAADQAKPRAQDSVVAQNSAAARRDNEPARRESAPLTQPMAQPDEQRAAPRAFPAAPEAPVAAAAPKTQAADRSAPAAAAGTMSESTTTAAASPTSRPSPTVAPAATPTAPALRAPLASRAPAPAGVREREGFAAAEMQKSARGAAAAAPFDVAALRQSIASEPWRWTWQRGAGSPQPVNDSLRNWLAQVDAAARWRQAAIGSDTRQTLAADSAASRELRLWRDGQWVATLRLGDGMLHWQGLSTTLQSPLDEGTQRSLQQSAP